MPDRGNGSSCAAASGLSGEAGMMQACLEPLDPDGDTLVPLFPAPEPLLRGGIVLRPKAELLTQVHQLLSLVLQKTNAC